MAQLKMNTTFKHNLSAVSGERQMCIWQRVLLCAGNVGGNF